MGAQAEALRAAGYRVSAQIPDAEVQAAMTAVEAAYVRKIYDFDRPNADVLAALRQLTSILLMQRRAVATRAGGKDKTTPSLSVDGGPTGEDFAEADRLLRKVQETHCDLGAVQGLPSTLVDDICGIYYRNVYLGL